MQKSDPFYPGEPSTLVSRVLVAVLNRSAGSVGTQSLSSPWRFG
jgi:hypothetical protein